MTDATNTKMPTLVERLRWNAGNSHNASRLNMGIDQVAAADEIERLRDILMDILHADARGGGVNYSEAMARAAAELAPEESKAVL